MKPIHLIPAVLAVAVSPATAFSADMYGEGYEIHPVNDAVYEAVSDGAHGGAAFWCAAGEFVEIKLRASPATPIFVVRGGGVSETTGRKTAAQFTIDAEAAGVTPAQSGGNLNELVVGESMTAGEARNFCSSG
ncbi:MAG: hypothetical protein ACK5MY_19075 [Jhaorihella sp.]